MEGDGRRDDVYAGAEAAAKDMALENFPLYEGRGGERTGVGSSAAVALWTTVASTGGRRAALLDFCSARVETGSLCA